MNISTSFHFCTKPNRKKTMYLTSNERRAVIKEANCTATVLLEYYLSAIGHKDHVITDQKAADATGLSLRRVQESRKRLEKSNLFWVNRTTGNGMTHYLYCVGKESVYCKKHFGKLFSCNTVSKIYRTYSREQFEDILAQSNLCKMAIKDITDLLDRHHDKQSKLKNGCYNPAWKSLAFC